MPLAERMLPDLNLLIVVGTGTVTAHDFAELYRREEAHRIDAGRDALVDLRRVVSLVIEHRMLGALVEQDADIHDREVYKRGRRRAIVGRGELEEGIVQLYRAMLERQARAAAVAAGTASFHTLDDALDFLQRAHDRERIETAIGELLVAEGS